jgi:hypothetical protein
MRPPLFQPYTGSTKFKPPTQQQTTVSHLMILILCTFTDTWVNHNFSIYLYPFDDWFTLERPLHIRMMILDINWYTFFMTVFNILKHLDISRAFHTISPFFRCFNYWLKTTHFPGVFLLSLRPERPVTVKDVIWGCPWPGMRKNVETPMGPIGKGGSFHMFSTSCCCFRGVYIMNLSIYLGEFWGHI